MPWRSFVDGPECPNPAALGNELEQVSSLRDRARRKERLVVDVEGKPEVRPTTANMKHNIDVLRPIVANMTNRNRVGTDPVEVLDLVCQAFYEKNRAHYPEIQGGLLEKVQLHAWSHADAWAIHKMLSYLRNIVPKYERMRDILLCI